MKTKLILLGTGTPNACPNASGPALAVVVNNRAYLVDCGPGIVRQCSKAYHLGIDQLRPDLLNINFITHLHCDHTLGLSDLIFTPWVLERKEKLQLYGPKGLKAMVKHLTMAYNTDISFRLNGPEKANNIGYLTNIKEIQEGVIYQDENISVEAFKTEHGTLESYGFKFVTNDKTIVIASDTKALDKVAQIAKNADILVHEVQYNNGLKDRDPKWADYHKQVHTPSIDLAKLCQIAKPKLTITTHRIYHMNMLDNTINLEKEMTRCDELILQEIKEAGYLGKVVNGKDLDIFELN